MKAEPPNDQLYYRAIELEKEALVKAAGKTNTRLKGEKAHRILNPWVLGALFAAAMVVVLLVIKPAAEPNEFERARKLLARMESPVSKERYHIVFEETSIDRFNATIKRFSENSNISKKMNSTISKFSRLNNNKPKE